MLRLEGPAVEPLAINFLEDWVLESDESLESVRESGDVHPMRPRGTAAVQAIPSGPAQPEQTMERILLSAIYLARKELVLTTPYFVPDESIMDALTLAAFRGVDVRILIPDDADHKIIYYAAFFYIDKFDKVSGLKFYRYTKGFMHQKTMLIDKGIAAIGTANFDNRSFRLNFELTALVTGRAFNTEVEEMFLQDFKHARVMQPGELNEKPYLFRLLVRLARLTAPML